MSKNDFRVNLTTKEKKDYRIRSFIFPNKLFNDLESLRQDFEPQPSLNKFVRKILELYVERSKK